MTKIVGGGRGGEGMRKSILFSLTLFWGDGASSHVRVIAYFPLRKVLGVTRAESVLLYLCQPFQRFQVHNTQNYW